MPGLHRSRMLLGLSRRRSGGIAVSPPAAGSVQINSASVLDSQIEAFIDANPYTGPIRLDLASNWSSPSSGDLSVHFAYDEITGNLLPFKKLAGEIVISGARRVLMDTTGLSVGDHLGPNDSSGKPTGTVTGDGVVCFVSTSDSAPSSRIAGIRGIKSLPSFTNIVTDCQSFSNSTPIAYNGISGFKLTANGTLKGHSSQLYITGLNNPHRWAKSVILEYMGHQHVYVGYPGGVNVDLVNGVINAVSNGYDALLTKLSTTSYILDIRSSADINSNLTYFVVHLAADSTVLNHYSQHDGTGSVGVYGATAVSNTGGYIDFVPCLMSNTSGSTMTRVADQYPITVAASSIPAHTILTSYEMPKYWHTAGLQLLTGDGVNQIARMGLTAKLDVISGAFIGYGALGNTAVGAVNRRAISTRTDGALNESVNGGIGVISDGSGDSYVPTFNALYLNAFSNGTSFGDAYLKQICIISSALAETDLQALTTEPAP